MAQNINLLNPALLPQPGPLSAQRLAVIGGAAVLVGAVLSVGLVSLDRADRAAHAAAARRFQAERDSLQQGLAALPPVRTAEALAQDVTRLEAERDRLEQLHARLQEGHLAPAQRHGALLRLLAGTPHPGLRLTGLQAGTGRVLLEGQALQAPAVRDWVTGLNRAPYFEGHPLQWLQLAQAASQGEGAAAEAAAGRLQFQLGTAEPASSERGRP